MLDRRSQRRKLAAGCLAGLAVFITRVQAEPGGVDWTALFRQSSYMLAIQHAFRLATEPGTREGLKGPYVRNYFRSLSNLHGWSDGDEAYVNYLGHPMQGAASGFIWIQNDRDFRTAEFGRDSRYWKSRLRASAWALAYSEQFEIGPISEASIGAIQMQPQATGLVDHVITPTVGFAWMVAEDAVDRYLIQRFERRVQNRLARILVRGWLNPSRSFANVMGGRYPWHRDTRPGVSAVMLASLEPIQPKRPVELREPRSAPLGDLTTYGAFSFSCKCPAAGGNASVAFRPNWRWEADVSGCSVIGGGDELALLSGMRWVGTPAGRWNPYLRVLVGMVKTSERKGETIHNTARFALAGGGGIDLRVTPAVGMRVAALDYVRTVDAPPQMQGPGLRFTTGVVLRFGTW